VKVGKMDEADDWQWGMSAWACEDGTECRAPAVELNPVIMRGSLQEFLSRSELAGELAVPGQLKVFIPRDVLEETTRLALAASPMECGGVLLGNLYRDHPRSGELFLVIAAHVPAIGAAGTEVELRFTPEAWHAVRTAVALRGREEMWCGWFHSHTPVAWADKCGQCPIERQRQCPLATRLFSDPDRVLHRAVFAQAFAVGLVANVLAGGEVVHACFGWHEGRIAARSYYVENRE
jgi:proteasome lid subunit RPN8/RPN11